MIYFKILLCLCSLWCLFNAIIEENLETAYDYLMYITIMMSLVLLIQPIN